jgi:hypothetical protein
VFIAVGLFASSALYLVAYWQLPNDGTVIDATTSPRRLGLVVQTIRTGDGLQTGDLVMAVDGQRLDAWLTVALRHPWQVPAPVAWLDYTVVRDGQTITVRQALRPSPLTTVLRQNWTTFFFLFYLEAIGVFIFVLRPRLPVAQLLLVFTTSLMCSSLMFFLGLPLSSLRYGWLVWLWVWGAIVVYGFLAGNGVHYSMIFPRPWLHWRQRRALVALAYAVVWLPFLGHLLWGWSRAAGTSGHLLLAVRASSTMSVIIFPMVAWLSGMSYRFARGEVERRQLRWIMWALMVAILPWAVFTALPQALGLPPLLPQLVVGVLWCALPTAFAISILRERLFDIDILINRSLVYGALSLVLVLTYFGGVVVLQSVFTTLTGQQRSQLATVLSTLAIAGLFNPLRQRLQRYVDRRFFRRKYDAARTLADFGATLRDDIDLDVLANRLEAVVHDTMQPEHARLWLFPDTQATALQEAAARKRPSLSQCERC